MRILHLIPTLAGGGAERQLGYLAAELTRRGHDVLVGYVDQGIRRWEVEGVRTVNIAGTFRWDPRLVARTVSLVRSWRPDVLHTWIVQMDVVGGIAAALTRVPWVVREPTTAIFYERGMKARLRLAIARAGADAVVANSEGGMAYWSRRAPRLRLRLIANAVPIEAIDAAPKAELEERRVVAYVGRLERMKNVDVVIAAAAELMRDEALDLVICGEGPDRPRLEALAGTLGVGDRVRFTGYTADAWRYMKAASLFLSLSDFEGCPNAVLEAFAAGTPVILSDIPAHRAIAGEECAYFAPLHDIAATAAVMRQALTDRSGSARRAKAARDRVAFSSIEAMTGAFEEVYRDVLAKRGRRPFREA